MAVAVVERTGVKIERSKGKARVSKERRRGWEDVNKMAAEGKVGGNGGNGFGVLVEDEEMGGVEEEGGGEERGGEGEGEEKVVEEDGDEIL
ncbi:hypothetical protein CDD81_6852 [Ophiocordyceps australis]|uniref:Uncharacterized protein n=1 Tax=Ophiocordyceps australis TaxID=1399860 RepID=A0A2C5XHB2_9HYPO|nr:hypothetical protein CDD81_6852 [Ophiocordyceps australis]